MAGEKAKGGKKNRKHKRNTLFCDRYQREGRHDINKAFRLMRVIRRQPNNVLAKAALGMLPTLAKKAAEDRLAKARANASLPL